MNKHEIERAKVQASGWLWNTRHAAAASLSLGASIAYAAVLDIAVVVHPVTSADKVVGPTRRWLGLLVVALLVAGLVFAGQSVVGFIGAVVPHRVERP